MAGPSPSLGSGFSDALTILGAAGIVIPAFARLKINPVIGFLIVGVIAGPFALGGVAETHRWLEPFVISDPHGIEPFAELGIILLLFTIGLELSFRRLVAMRRQVFGIGATELVGGAALIALFLAATGTPFPAAGWLAVALAMSSTALVLPIAGQTSAGLDGAVGRGALAMLLFEDLALVPLLLLLGAGGDWGQTALYGAVAILAVLLVGRYALPSLFAQAARAKKPELFLAISLLTVILAAGATGKAGLSPILGALLAGLLIAETDYAHEVEMVVEPFKGLALGVFLITVGMRIDPRALASDWPRLLGALAVVIALKAIVTGLLLFATKARRGVAAETGLLMASPGETTLILLGAAGTAKVLGADAVAFWSAVSALGMMVTPLLASAGRWTAGRVDRGAAELPAPGEIDGATLVFGFGRVGRMVATMLERHGRAAIGIDSDIDGVKAARADGYAVRFGDVARKELVEKLDLARAAAAVLTMDDPVLTTRLTERLRARHPTLPIIARARDAAHAAALYRAGVTDAVPEALEASLQLSEAVLVDIGVAMGPVIASIHERRSELRAQIMDEGALDVAPRLGRRRVRDMGTSTPPGA
ncbi:cation:proton antiporter [Sphingomonas sp. ASV193]|uniref:cation:proton antiporter domain-containing protein n=1 Tax=Sphingomonas sp. ASV193 TaxID=3144405 RepID=UPI0032E86132